MSKSRLMVMPLVCTSLALVGHLFGQTHQATNVLDDQESLVDGNVAPTEPVGLYLIWQQDPTTTMTIDWHTEVGDQADPIVRYKVVGEGNWGEIKAAQHPFPYSNRTIHRVELTELHPDTFYRFRVGEFSRAYKFRTMPLNIHERPLVIAAGGDTSHGRHMRQMNRVAMEYDPDFIVWGGDLAYADGHEDRVWYKNGLI
jgi:hypothetical protein